MPKPDGCVADEPDAVLGRDDVAVADEDDEEDEELLLALAEAAVPLLLDDDVGELPGAMT